MVIASEAKCTLNTAMTVQLQFCCYHMSAKCSIESATVTPSYLIHISIVAYRGQEIQ